MTGAIAWACRTPRRLITVLAVPLVLTVIAASLWSGYGKGDGGGRSDLAAAAAANAQMPDAAPFVTAAVTFVNVWGRLAPGQTPQQWHDAVRALATPDLATKLQQTDTASLEGATATGKPQVRFVTTTSALIAVPMSNGHTVVVTVVSGQDKNWLVDDVEPDVGN
jgi:hypothetical protein